MARQRKGRPERLSDGLLVPEPDRRHFAPHLFDLPEGSGVHCRPNHRNVHLPAQHRPTHAASPRDRMIRLWGGRVAGLFLAAAIVLGAGLGLRDPWPPDEPRFALVATEMVASGDWLIPRVGGVNYPDKPPLFFWAIAAAYAATGSIDVAFLLPAFLSGLVVLALVYDLARRLWGPE